MADLHSPEPRDYVLLHVASSLALISKEPSPVSTNGFTLELLEPPLAPMEAGMAKPMEAQ
jgi:hypothetical protein